MTEEQIDRDGARDWSEEAKGLLKAELKRRNMTYAGLVDALRDVGVNETEANLRNKISRGNFSAAFFLQALDAIGCAVLYLNTDGVGRGRANLSEATRKRFR
ncbi:MAG: DUF6471 domain-containing protein [Phenylobacterium sp.]|uniref:DUF6471 domain-containing protein n=1 Tax=Phenylobacterium sp. TaxID=1871053 RepID=UPI00391D0B3D